MVLADPQVTADFRTFVSRARSVNDGAVHLQAWDQVLAAYVSIMKPAFLGDGTPTILGLRTMMLGERAQAELTVALGAMADRLARMGSNDVLLPVPPMEVRESWTGVLPPRSGWVAEGTLAAEALNEAAAAGIREISQAVPANPGKAIVDNARSAVWGRDLELPAADIPAGAAFAAFSLGFLGEEPAAVFRNGRWLRVSTPRGHVLVRRAASLHERAG
ncbi:hypothetical protein D477_005151 [Arthrobacter crystallopoietes BAB-32]|uniref:Uncharacterized protein n=1 Tax=Arthrobacter crystallopoietes BAB-32 TaxID=1246476 RepID=N1VAE1_9MICC|nr:hypothetical protein D477_005151 [Arthrobacter crystallopoietes BAB-32]